MRTGNAIMIGVCGFILLSEWSKPGRMQFAFPFVTQPIAIAEQVPSSTKENVLNAVQSLDDGMPKLEESSQPASQCSGTSGTFNPSQLQEFRNRYQSLTLQQTTEILGEPQCKPNPKTTVYLGLDGSRLEVYGTDKVEGFKYAPSIQINTTGT